MRASHDDREQVIATLKAAFVQGMLAKDEFAMRVGQAFASRTYAELAALTADLPAGLTDAQPPRPARAHGEAVIPRPRTVLTVATVIYAGMWAFFLPLGTLGGPGGAGMLTGIATVFYWIVVIFAGAQLLESRRHKRSGGPSPRRPALDADGQPVQPPPSAGPGGQLPPAGPGHLRTEATPRHRPRPPLPVRGHCAGGVRIPAEGMIVAGSVAVVR
jgi:hypothetical protein